MPKKIALLQSNYIPWKGYFDIIRCVDEFVLYDECQYTKNDWRNRNMIRVPGGAAWLTIPVRTTGKTGQTISETLVSESHWAKKHWQSLVTYYSRAPYFKPLAPRIKALYEQAAGISRLSAVNHLFLTELCGLLGIRTPITWSSDYPTGESDPTKKIVGICVRAGAEVYLSGPSGRNYMRVELFEEAGVALEWMEYSGYPDYRQLHEPCIHAVSILDVLFNVGPEEALGCMQRPGRPERGGEAAT
jgi:hypothetical protein